MEELPFPD